MAKTTPIRVKIKTARSLREVAKGVGCTMPELLARIEDGDLASLAAWQRAASKRHDDD